jgi:hypothetical protein
MRGHHVLLIRHISLSTHFSRGAYYLFRFQCRLWWDQIVVHLPLSLKAQARVSLLMFSYMNLLSSGDHPCRHGKMNKWFPARCSINWMHIKSDVIRNLWSREFHAIRVLLVVSVQYWIIIINWLKQVPWPLCWEDNFTCSEFGGISIMCGEDKLDSTVVISMPFFESSET